MARSKWGLISGIPHLGKLILRKGTFDVVVTFEVIEHLLQPHEFVRELLEYVRPGGYLLIMTDNFESRVVQQLGAAFPKWIPHTHVSHFSPASLERVLADNGSSIEARLSFTPWELIARNLFYKLSRKNVQSVESFNLENALKSEMSGTFHMFRLRHLLNKTWARLSADENLNGELMYVLASSRG